MNESLRNRFLELKIIGQRCGIPEGTKKEKDKQLIDWLQRMIHSGQITDFEDLGFCYFNISDNFAMLRDGDSLYQNHKCLLAHVLTNSDLYLFWTVCDATQKLTLETNGCSEFWWELYRNAVARNKEQSKYPFAEFHVHRAALCYPPFYGKDENRFYIAKNNFLDFLEKTKDSPFTIFFYAIFLSMTGEDTNKRRELLDCAEYLLQDLSVPEEKSEFLCGEWNSFTTPFTKRKQAHVGIVSCINALIDKADIQTAKSIYTKAKELGLPRNLYIERRF